MKTFIHNLMAWIRADDRKSAEQEVEHARRMLDMHLEHLEFMRFYADDDCPTDDAYAPVDRLAKHWAKGAERDVREAREELHNKIMVLNKIPKHICREKGQRLGRIG